MNLNERAARLTDRALAEADSLGLAVCEVAGARIIDAGANTRGGLAAGVMLARVCMADLADVAIVPGEYGPVVTVYTDHPVAACLGSQYAGWQVHLSDYFAMGSGPMRAIRAAEPLFADIGGAEKADRAVGVLETRRLPPPEVVADLARKLQLTADRLMLWVAPTASLAAGVQIAARTVETALHKLHELKFDVTTIVHGHGVAPLPPPAKDDFAALGRTNDAILYGSRVHLWLRCADELIAEVGPQSPANSSPSWGTPFLQLFDQAGRDFYKMDPQLFAPAEVVFHNLQSGRTFAFGVTDPAVVRRSFGV